MRFVFTLIFLFVSNPIAASAIGRITDSATGKPIAGAIVYAVWNYHPISIPLPVEGTHVADKLCGGSAIATTGADGYYDFEWTTSTKVHLHEAHQWVIAEGYYNDWQGPQPGDQHDFAQLLSQLRWDPSGKQKDGWSKQLTPLGNATIDAKLLVLAMMIQSTERCEPSTKASEANLQKFRLAVRRAMTSAICEAQASEQAPRADVYRAAFMFFGGRSSSDDLLRSPSVRPLIPRRQRSPIPNTLVGITCALTSAQSDEGYIDLKGE